VTSVAANNFALTKTGDLCTQGLVTIRVTNVVGTVVSRSWSPISGSGTMITVYDPGTYTCTTTFAGGCQVSRSVFIAQPAGHCQIRLMAADEQDPDQVPAQDFKEEVAVTSFYPNPVDKEINLTTPSEPVARKISLINMQGVEVHTSIMPATATSTRIPLGSLSDGMYLLQIQSPTTVERLKVMVNQKR